MKPSLFLHIGHGKTGSTTIQYALRDNAEALRARGLLLADGDLRFPVSGRIELHPLILFDRLLWRVPEEVALAEMRLIQNDLKGALQAGGYRGAVISSENLCSEHGPRLFAGFQSEFDLHVIYYVRRQDEWLESSWKQWGLKEGIGLAEYVRNQIALGQPDYLRSARDWREIAKTMRVVPTNGIPDIIRSFWDALGLTDFNPPPTPSYNQSFDWSILEVLSKNPYLFSSVRDNRLFELLDNLLPEEPPRDGHALLDRDSAQEVMDAHRESNQVLQREFFPDYQPLGDYPPRRSFSAAVGRSDETAALYRFMGFQLLMLQTLQRQNTARDLEFGKMKARIDKLKADNRALRHRTSDIEQKQKQTKALSLSKRLKRWLRKRDQPAS